MSEREDGGMGCMSVGVIVLIVLWLVGYWDKPKSPPLPTEKAAPTEKETP